MTIGDNFEFNNTSYLLLGVVEYREIPYYVGVDNLNKDLLIAQLKAMETYLTILSIRIGLNTGFFGTPVILAGAPFLCRLLEKWIKKWIFRAFEYQKIWQKWNRQKSGYFLVLL